MFGHLALLALLINVFSSQAQTSEAPYYGVWRLNPARSDFGRAQLVVEQTAAGQFTLTDSTTNNSYSFRIDGKPHPGPGGLSVVWTEKSPRSWRVSYTMNGRPVAEESYDLSADGQSLTARATILGPKTLPEQRVVMERNGSGDGLAGTWLGAQLQVPSFEMEILRDGPDGLLVRVPKVFEVKGRFDGQPYPMSTAFGSGTAVFTHLSATSFRMVHRRGNATTLDATVAASTDGKTLVESGVNQVGAKTRMVFDRVK